MRNGGNDTPQTELFVSNKNHHDRGVGLMIPLAYVAVTPLDIPGDTHTTPSWTNAGVKRQLLRMRSEDLRGTTALSIQWSSSSSSSYSGGPTIRSGGLFRRQTSDRQDTESSSTKERLLYLRHSDPVASQLLWPCHCVGYVVSSSSRIPPPSPEQNKQNVSCSYPRVCVTEATMIRIVPPVDEKGRLTGECAEIANNDDSSSATTTTTTNAAVEEILVNQNPETIQELTFHLNSMLSTTAWVGTTHDALSNRRRQQDRKYCLQRALKRHYESSSPTDRPNDDDSVYNPSNTNANDGFPSKAALIVHSPDHGAGKTSLVQVLLRQKCHCQRIHLIRPGPLLAKYGVYADAALSTIVHEAVLSAAFDQQPVAVVLDHLDAFLSSGSGDAALPAVNGMASYLKQLTRSLLLLLQQNKGEIPFPSAQASLYNWKGQKKNGYALPVHFCLVGIVTCPDDGGGGGGKKKNGRLVLSSTTALDYSMSAARYRLPTLSADTRLRAFRFALLQQQIQLSPELEKQLPFLAAAAVGAKGADFRRIGILLAQSLSSSSSGSTVATVESFQETLSRVLSGTSGSNVHFLDAGSAHNSPDSGDRFASVGGNQEAKIALEDALAIDPVRRQRMESLGISIPSGVLLYGPPGTGKTLLARAVAKVLRSKTNSTIGGAFVSLSSTDIVRAEIGSGEKMVAMAFETAKLNSPSVVFIDEFQALFTERSSSGGSTRLTSTLLLCMDDLKRWRDLDHSEHESTGKPAKEHQIVVLAATNTPWMVDRSFLRPGRFDRAVHVGLPNMEERSAILELHLKRMKIQTDDLSALCSRLAVATAGFSGADISAFSRAAAVRCLIQDEQYLREQHFADVLNDGLRPSSDEDLVERIARWRPC